MFSRKIINQRNGHIVASNFRQADTFFTRLKGLLGSSSLGTGHGLWIVPCKGVHTVGMRYAIDVIFVDKKHRIKKLVSDLKPYRFCCSAKGTHSVIEVPVGTIDKSQLKRGDKLIIEDMGQGDCYVS